MKKITVNVYAKEDYDDVHDELMLSDFMETPKGFETEIAEESPMKAILEFNLPEDRKDHLRACKATEAYLCLSSMADFFRRRIKYNDGDTRIYEECQKELHDIMENYGVRPFEEME